MNVIGHWTLTVYLKNATFKWGLLTIPQKNYAVQRADGSCWSVVESTNHAREAWEFVKFAAGMQGLSLWAREQFITPAHRLVASSDLWLRVPGHPHISKVPFVYGVEKHAFNGYGLVHPRRDSFFSVIDAALNRVYNKETDPKSAISSIIPVIEKLLAEVAAR